MRPVIASLMAAVLIGAAGFRVCRLITTDDVFNKPRIWFLQQRLPKTVFEVFSCPWCLPFYVNLPIVLVTWAFESMAAPPLVFFASWTITSITTVRMAPKAPVPS